MEAHYNILNYRRELCERCPTPCDKQNDVGFRAEGDNACPLNRWQAFKSYVKNPNRLRGLGDVVAVVAEPIAKMLKKKGCSACAKRREMLNHLVPFGQKSPPK